MFQLTRVATSKLNPWAARNRASSGWWCRRDDVRHWGRAMARGGATLRVRLMRWKCLSRTTSAAWP
eukprot:6579777-Heterocapsa_arctica.AAC.1